MPDTNPQIFVFTAGHPDARSHLDDSIINPIALETAIESFSADDHEEIRQIHEQHGLYAWGAVPGPKNQTNWARMQAGDLVLCCFDSTYHYVSKVVATFNNRELATAVWGTDPKGNTWQLMYFLEQPIAISRPTNKTQDYLNQRYMGFTRISDEKNQRIIRDFDSLDGFVEKVLINDAPATSPNYFLARSNEDNEWDDEEGQVYRYGSSVPNHKQMLDGGYTVIDSRSPNGPRITGFGKLLPGNEIGAYETAARQYIRYESKFETWTKFDSAREIPEAILTEIRETPGYNNQHAIRRITKEIYDSLTNSDVRDNQIYFLFQANPKYFDARQAVHEINEMTWLVNQNQNMWRPGQKGVIWESGSDGGVIAFATILTAPAMMPEDDDALRFQVDSSKFDGEKLRVRISIDTALDNPLPRASMKDDPRLADLPVLRFANATNFQISPEEYQALVDLATPPPSSPALANAAQSFATALRDSNINFGRQHDDIVCSFVCALATKPFVILTGLSGSGKTQIAIRFGDWLGEDQRFIAPVRPDWTGAEALFGFENSLIQISNDGRAAWHVPAALAFMLKAVEDPENPYLLVLDEMNLAHVERYFADVLSGMESRESCLPNLEKDDAGIWRSKQSSPTHVPFPTNLFVVGTVNVDETTYMFSPKVLDRANTFEFRVSVDDLSLDSHAPKSCEPGDDELVSDFLAIARNTNWHHDNSTPDQSAVADQLKLVHKILSPHGFEFGHRVFSESIRFSTLYQSACANSKEGTLDRILMQKILPRLHGSRRKIEPLLQSLASFCFDPNSSDDGSSSQIDLLAVNSKDAKLPISFEKVIRMLTNVRANQFVSFTE